MTDKKDMLVRNVPRETKEGIEGLAKEKGYAYTNDFIIDLLNDVLDDYTILKSKNYFSKHWNQLQRQVVALYDVQKIGCELSVARDQATHEALVEMQKMLNKMKDSVHAISSFQQIELLYDHRDFEKYEEDIKKFSPMHKQFFEKEFKINNGISDPYL